MSLTDAINKLDEGKKLVLRHRGEKYIITNLEGGLAFTVSPKDSNTNGTIVEIDKHGRVIYGCELHDGLKRSCFNAQSGSESSPEHKERWQEDANSFIQIALGVLKQDYTSQEK